MSEINTRPHLVVLGGGCGVHPVNEQCARLKAGSLTG